MKPLLLGLATPLALVVVQQQLLLRLPPHLERLEPSQASQGPAALTLQFSRPMNHNSVASASRLQPPQPGRWLGDGNRLSLNLEPGSTITGPLTLLLGGRDQRGSALRPGQWRWDPRPRVLAVVPTNGGEQLHLLQSNGRWQPLSPVWAQIVALEPLGDGSAVALVSRNAQKRLQIWRIPLQQRNLAPLKRGLAPVRADRPHLLDQGDLVFAHLSSNRRGELLIQQGGMAPGSAITVLWPKGQRPKRLPLEASGPMRLLPQGGAVVVPASDGLLLHDLPPRPPRQQTLPGRRDLSSFCPRTGRALLVRHWPDFRRSLELVEPGQAPRQLWIGSQAVVASSCSGGGERVWLALVEGVQRPQLTVLALDRRGRLLARRPLVGWELEPGTPLSHDPSRNQLLLVLRPWGQGGALAPPAQVMLLDGTSLAITPLGKQARLALWLPP